MRECVECLENVVDAFKAGDESFVPIDDVLERPSTKAAQTRVAHTGFEPVSHIKVDLCFGDETLPVGRLARREYIH